MAKACIIVTFGTRPELLKLVAIIKLLEQQKQIAFFIINANQQQNLIQDILDYFDIKPHFNFSNAHHHGNLNVLNAHLIQQFNTIFCDLKQQHKKLYLIVQGDTASTYCAALSAFHLDIEIGHVEAGLRTFDVKNPFPEEYYRRSVSLISTHHFAPTAADQKHLLNEGIKKKNTMVTGNTIIDLVQYVKQTIKYKRNQPKTVVVTFHRRENDMDDLFQLSHALLQIAKQNPQIQIKWVLHPNKNAQINYISNIISAAKNIELIKPLPYLDFLTLLLNSHIVITDSGGVQEEAYFLKKPTIILRQSTERGAGVDLGFHVLSPCQTKSIVLNFNKLSHIDQVVSNTKSYGTGHAARKILDFIAKLLKE